MGNVREKAGDIASLCENGGFHRCGKIFTLLFTLSEMEQVSFVDRSKQA